MPFNVKDNRKVKPSAGPLATEATSTVLTGNGAPGFLYDEKSQLFLLAANSMFGQDKFYEKAKAGDDRFVTLVRKVAKADPDWMLSFILWLRQSGNMRTGAVVAGVEAALALKDTKPTVVGSKGPARRAICRAIGRADEIGEAVAYYFSKHPAAQIPKPIKRGLADALTEHFNEYTAMKYGNSDSKEYTPDRLINLLHPSPKAPWQADLFGYLLARRYGEVEIPTTLKALAGRKILMGYPVEQRRRFLAEPHAAQVLREVGMTWEALAGWLQGPMDAKAWEAIIPNMGYMALLRNLRNFDQAGISNKAAAYVMATLCDESKVARSKQFPFRFVAAHRAAPHIRWGAPLSMALDASLANIPKLAGRTLILVDTSGSMDVAFSEHSEMKRWDAAALFGIALAKTAEKVDLYSFSTGIYGRGQRNGVTQQFRPTLGADLLSEMADWVSRGHNVGGGTPTAQAVAETYRGHDRVIILTDEQADVHGYGNVFTSVPADRHCFTFNLAGYRQAHAPTSKFRHAFGGLTDACFPLVSMIEEGSAGRWPWERAE